MSEIDKNENNSTERLKMVMNWGAITGIVLIILGVIFYMLGIRESKIAQLVSFAGMIACLYFGMKQYRDTIGNGFISYSKSLGTGVKISFFSSIIMGFYVFIFFNFIDSNLIIEMLNQQEQAMIDKDMPTEQIEQAMNMTKKFMTPTTMAVMSVLSFTLMGSIFSLIISLFVKREDKSFEGGFLDQ
jgi:Protein of unknown function (DUF4199)